MATICQPEKARALCHQLAPILLWCVEEQVAPTAPLERLSYLLDQHGQLSKVRLLLRGGPSSPALASLAVHQFAALCRQLLGKQLACTKTPAPSAPAMGAAGTAAGPSPAPPAAVKAAVASAAAAVSDPPPWLAGWQQEFMGSACFLRNAAPWLHLTPGDASAACTAAAATVLTLHQLARQGQVTHNVIEVSIAALVDMAAGLLRLPSCCQHKEEHKTQQEGRREQQRQRQDRQAPLRIPTEGPEAVAVCCSGLNALLERGSKDPGDSCWTVALNDAIRLQDTLADRLDEGVLSLKLPTAVAAAESALRLAAQLIKSWPELSALPGAQQEGLPTRVSDVYSCLQLGAVELVKSATSALRQLGEQSGLGSGGTAPVGSHESEAGCSSQQASTGRPRDESSLSASDLAALGRSVAHLAASAAKLGELQADTAAQAATFIAEDDVWLIPVAMLVCEVHSLQRSRSSPEAQVLLIRQFAGSMLPLVGAFAKLNTSNPTLPLVPDSSGQNLIQPTLDKMGALAELLARLDAMPAGAVAWLQETLLDTLHSGWHTMRGLADEIPKWRAELLKGLGLAAGCIAGHAREWQRSAYLAVQMGFVLDLAVWAEEATTGGCSSAYTEGLQGAWQMTEAVSHRVMLQAGDDPTMATADRAVREVLHRVEQLGPARQRKQQRSPKFWEQQVKQELLPALDTLASAAAANGSAFDAQARELLALRAMATRVCTSPRCCNIRGCSEGRLRSRRCSGCGVARYCCHACQLADFWAHCKVCPLLAAEARS